jgi:hypothetical protein
MKSATAAKRRRTQSIRQALQKAIRETEEARTRAAYLAQPDSEAEADDWSTPEEYRERSSTRSGRRVCPSRQVALG